MTDEKGDTIKTVNNQNIVGAFVNRTCMCTGYSKAMTYLCNAAGIDCLYIWSGEHAFNIVKLYGNWYNIDLTWMDKNIDDHDFERVDKSDYNVNKSYETFSKSGTERRHMPGEFYKEQWNINLPTCSKDKVTK